MPGSGGGYSPAPPRSCAPHKSCVGLPTSLTASEEGKRVIAGKKRKEEEDKVERADWETEKDEIDLYEEERSSSDWDMTEEEYRKVGIEELEYRTMISLGCLPNEEEMGLIQERIQKEVEEIYYGDRPYFAMDFIKSTALKMLDSKMEHKAKIMELRICANTIGNVIRLAEKETNLEMARGIRYREGYQRMKEKYIIYRRKYEALAKRDLKEVGVQARMEEEMDIDRDSKEVGVQVRMEEETDIDREKSTEKGEDKGRREEEGVEKKVEYLIEKVKELERKIPEKSGNINKERREEEQWTKVLGRKGRQKEEGSRQKVPAQREEGKRKEEARQRSKSRSRPLKAVEKKLPKGAGVIIEVQGGRSKDYEELIKECEKAIPLKGIGIPPIGIRRTRAGGILMEIKGD